MRDNYYHLTNILYHSMKNLEKCALFIRQAEHDEDRELASFFKQIQKEEVKRIDQAKGLLWQRLTDDLEAAAHVSYAGDSAAIDPSDRAYGLL